MKKKAENIRDKNFCKMRNNNQKEYSKNKSKIMFPVEHYFIKIFGKEDRKSPPAAFWSPENPLKQ